MPELNYIIGKANYEIANYRIAEILADELANQKVLLEDAIQNETDPVIKADYELSLASIPSRVFVDRGTHPGVDETPFLNVSFVEAPMDDQTTHNRQIGENTYVLETWQTSSTMGNDVANRGDALAAKKCQRLLFICQQIIMAQDYYNLGYITPFIGWRRVSAIGVAQLEKGADASQNSTFGKCNVIIKLHEEVRPLDGPALEGIDTELKLNKTDLGLYWSITN